MISIRFQIFLLAIVALIAMSSAFFLEYRDIKGKILLTNNTLIILDKIQSLSDLIHPIQKERGLTAGQLIGDDKVLHDLYLQQHSITEKIWNQSSHNVLFQEREFFQRFPERLQEMRKRIEAKNVNWEEVKRFYTNVVHRLLESMVLKVASLNYIQEISYDLQSLPYFTTAREYLGLIRAGINRGSQQGYLSTVELIDISNHYGVFSENIRVFEVISKSDNQEDYPWVKNLRNEVFNSTMRQIKDTLNSTGKILPSSPSIWWQEATQVVDNMKTIENTIIKQIKQRTIKQLAQLNDYLYWYGIFAFVMLVLVALLTTITVLRILKALSILIHSLDQVEKTQNFGLRIYSNSFDECGKLTLSINSLLSYTDKIVKEKDSLASTDFLTGVMNRRSFIKIAKSEIKRSERHATPLSLIFCDIDHFKVINDKYGHAIGDQVLKEFCQLLQENLRSHDYIGRWGGEEFIILAPETELSLAEQLSEKLRKRIMDFSIQSVNQITTSFGIAEKQPNESFDKLCERADKALYKAKENGRNRVCSSEGTEIETT